MEYINPGSVCSNLISVNAIIDNKISEKSYNLTPVVGNATSMASQCMPYCQSPASQGKAFTFTQKIGETFSFSMDTKEKTPSPVPVKNVRKINPFTMKRNALRRQKLLASKNGHSSNKEAMETPAEGSDHLKPPVSCEECGQTTQTIGGKRLHEKNKHSFSQVDGNTSLVDIIEKETVDKHFSYESLCN